jgi:hypothetical protein
MAPSQEAFADSSALNVVPSLEKLFDARHLLSDGLGL